MSAKYHINPRFRAYGKARLDVTLRANDEQEWQEMWREPLNLFPFRFASGWKICLEYVVEDYAAEVGFFIDVLGFTVTAFSPRFAQFTSPGEELCLQVLEAAEGQPGTPPDCIRLIFQLSNADETLRELNTRGIAIEKVDSDLQSPGSTPVGYFRTPHGLRIDLWDQPSAPVRGEVDRDDRDYHEPEAYESDDADETLLEVDSYEDIEEAFDLDGLAQDEADRIIDKLLGLSAEPNNQEDISDNLEEEDQLEIQDGEEEAGDEISSGLISRPKALHWKPAGQAQLPESKASRSPVGAQRNRSADWPKSDDRRNGELSYEEIDDE